MAPLLSVALLFHLLLTTQIQSALAERVQYCRFGHQDGEADFCMGVSSYLNATTDQHDLYIALSVRRSSALGWTAVGTGPSMAGALMFIVYGDPSSGDHDPVVSIRTADGHHQPRPISDSTGNTTTGITTGPDIRITHAKWQALQHEPSSRSPSRRHGDEDSKSPPPPPPPATGPTHAAVISLTCYSCTLFSGSRIDATSSSQPWIWAWNDRQRFDFSSSSSEAYAPDTHLDMHKHRADGGGFGVFYVDMARARQSLVRMHGWVMGAAFLVGFPVGAGLIRWTRGAGKGAPFKRHWVMQFVATGLAWVGATVAAVMTGGRLPRTVHQWLGVGIVLVLGLQGLLGWRHHVRFLRIRRRTWVSHAHIWLGRTVVAGGWANVILGMLLAGRGALTVVLAAGLILLEAAGLGFFLWRAQLAAAKRSAPGTTGGAEVHALMPRDGSTDDYFALEMSDEDDEDDMSETENDDLKRRLGNGSNNSKRT
ncbi:iron reductase domain protein [Canariomyces notabilis]|uniref:Iron reductase domain protein n=1 Tax=Canariomyces notabilis TaxID=2074819 RepID=A0AAN6T912_9PEZI|nr:iron reductase domain protein [Canariomyces arenarius]